MFVDYRSRCKARDGATVDGLFTTGAKSSNCNVSCIICIVHIERISYKVDAVRVVELSNGMVIWKGFLVKSVTRMNQLSERVF